MINFRPILHLNVLPVLGGLVNRLKNFDDNKLRQETPGSPHKDSRVLLLRTPAKITVESWFADVTYQPTAMLKDWPTMDKLLKRIRRAVLDDSASPGHLNMDGVMGKAMIVELKPGGVVQWHVDEGDYAERHHRFHVPLTTNPGCALYSGGESSNPQVGLLFWFNNHVQHSALNSGMVPRIHLIVDFRRKDAE